MRRSHDKLKFVGQLQREPRGYGHIVMTVNNERWLGELLELESAVEAFVRIFDQQEQE